MEKQENQENQKKRSKTKKQIALLLLRYTYHSIKWLIIAGFVAAVLGGGVAAGYVASMVKDEPVRTKEEMVAKMNENAITGFVYFNDDTVVGQLRSEEDRRLADLQDIPQSIIDAVFSIEDNDFYTHHGIDMKATLRAVYQKILHKPIQTGGSTITQQLARRVYLTLDKEDSRKAKELFLALRMERLMSKDEILLAYLNKIPYGNGSSGYNLYGIKAAAKGIFNIDDLKELNTAQAAYLAGLPQQPSNYSAFTSKGEFDGAAFKRASTRQQLVLRRMLEEGRINQQQYQDALQFDLKQSLAPSEEKAYSTYPYLMMEVEKEASKALLKAQDPKLDPQASPEKYNEALKNAQAQLLRGGYRIYTTIDKPIYDSFREIADNSKLFSPDDPKNPAKGPEQVGGIMIDSKTGAILGMIEGRNFYQQQLNHATQSLRQPGSTMKPIAAYLPAIDKGAIGPASIIDDVPVILKDGTKVGYHIPENWDEGFHGLITARRALNQSYNIPAIKLFLDVVGIKEAWEFAKKLGITSITKDDYVAQTGVIGGLKYGVSVKELTGAYAAISNKGVFNEPYIIRKITDTNGKIVYEHDNKPTIAFSEETAYIMTDMMRTVITSGTATDIMSKFKHYGKVPVVGKTGSTQDDADAWFMGYSPDITMGVWIGYDSPVYKLSKATGGTNRAKDIWALAMDAAINKQPDLFETKKFVRPPGIVDMTVSSVSGKLPSEATTKARKLVTDIFNKNFIPTEEDNMYVKLPIISYNDINYIAKQTTPAEFVDERTVVRREKSVSSLLKEISEIQGKLPPDRRRSIDRYKPTDYEDDAPTEEDPRTDDGKPPAPPTTVVVTRSGNSNTLTFQASGSEDVVGYRIYRSSNHENFQVLTGQSIKADQEAKLTDPISGAGIYGYYVTAVDVAGNESVPSKASYTDGSSVDPLFLTPGDTPAIPGKPGDPSNPNNNGSTGNNGINGNNGTTGNNGTDKKDGLPTPVQPSAVDKEPPKAPPAAPAGFSVHAVGAGIQLTWNPNEAKDKVKKYVVYFNDKDTGAFTKLGEATEALEFNYYSVSYNGFYQVTAVNDAGESKPSSVVKFTK
ncbi:transglycosylase domain-containing protein [Paenibacillus thalictri]|uniref:Carboxypeptidase n=1 Tax=Paenibacillus thalictri TaxID=2527873 RepID=A0A4Q9DUC0_9BACL|nr:transglycosylase domain-containing protein [Paenibacillus thalictri]TBL78297.1 carboxypeptidase [Paenibacillus thalictri]